MKAIKLIHNNFFEAGILKQYLKKYNASLPVICTNYQNIFCAEDSKKNIIQLDEKAKNYLIDKMKYNFTEKIEIVNSELIKAHIEI